MKSHQSPQQSWIKHGYWQVEKYKTENVTKYKMRLGEVVVSRDLTEPKLRGGLSLLNITQEQKNPKRGKEEIETQIH